MAEIPDYKILKKLADSCRKAGIKSFKGFGMEFTLSDEIPTSNYKANKASKQIAQADSSDEIESDSLTDDALLMWSSTLSNDINDLKGKQ